MRITNEAKELNPQIRVDFDPQYFTRFILVSSCEGHITVHVIFLIFATPEFGCISVSEQDLQYSTDTHRYSVKYTVLMSVAMNLHCDWSEHDRNPTPVAKYPFGWVEGYICWPLLRPASSGFAQRRGDASRIQMDTVDRHYCTVPYYSWRAPLPRLCTLAPLHSSLCVFMDSQLDHQCRDESALVDGCNDQRLVPRGEAVRREANSLLQRKNRMECGPVELWT